MNRFFGIFAVAAICCLASGAAWSGDLDSPGAPTDAASRSYTLEDVYNRLDTGAAGTQDVFAEPGAGPGATGHTVNDVMDKTPVVDDADGATPEDVADGKTFWGLTSGAWGPRTGARFTANGDGTVTDNRTGLVWLENANPPGMFFGWDFALDFCNTLADGTAGLTDGSSAGDWRLPNIRELQSLVDYTESDPALPSGHPFIDVRSGHYWSSSDDFRSQSWGIRMNTGEVELWTKDMGGQGVWPVRDGN